jgi:glycerophosphoryl diester phosphodiesterase
VLLSSFNPWCLWRLKRAGPELLRGVLVDPDRSQWVQEGLLVPWLAGHSVHPFVERSTREGVEAWHRARLKVAVWTVDSPERARELRDWGVEYCITNRPALLHGALGPTV